MENKAKEMFLVKKNSAVLPRAVAPQAIDPPWSKVPTGL